MLCWIYDVERLNMKNINTFIQSGILESYVLGLASDEEMEEVESMSALYPAVQEAIDFFCNSLEINGLANATPPPPTVKTMVMASIDFIERMQAGESPSFPKILSDASKIADYNEWINRPDMVTPPHFEDIYAKIIGYTPKITTAIVWIKTMAPQEIHTDEFERFLIVEGTCDITIGEKIHQLKPGDYLGIPLFQNHHVVVTSKIPCKVILQRVAA